MISFHEGGSPPSNGGNGGSGGGGGDNGGGGSNDEDEGPILSFKEVSTEQHALGPMQPCTCHFFHCPPSRGSSNAFILLPTVQVEAFMKERNIKLPNDMLEVAKQGGLRLRAVEAYVACQVGFGYPI